MPEEINPQYDNRPSTEPTKKEPLDIYTMPDKFMTLDKGTGGGGKNSRVLFIVVAVVVVGILIAAGIFVFQKYISPKSGNTNLVVVNNKNNANQNTNLNQNVNQNTNLNQNTNQNTNTNLNLNLFNMNNAANQNSNLNVSILPSSKDSDLDGLTDVEENLYGTDPQKADTDGDSYLDGQEIVNGYNPLGAGRLEDMPAGKNIVTKYTSPTLNFTVLYPASWVQGNDSANPGGVIFSTTTGEFISISAQDNPAGLSARDWYLAESPGIDTTKVESVTNWAKNLEGVKSLDGTTVYYVKDTKAYVINYNTNVLSEANFFSTFEMVYRSFQLVTASTVNANTNLNANTNTTANTNFNSNTNVNSNLNANQNTNTNRNSNTNTYTY